MSDELSKKIDEIVNDCFYMSRVQFLHYYGKFYTDNSTLETFWFGVRDTQSKSGKNALSKYPEVETLAKNCLENKKPDAPSPEVVSKPIEEVIQKQPDPKPIPEVKSEDKNYSQSTDSIKNIFESKGSKISKLVNAFKAGYSCDFISQWGRDNGHLAKHYSPSEVKWQIKQKGIEVK